MSDEEGRKERAARGQKRQSTTEARKIRTAQQLRANLAKRKQQQRSRNSVVDAEGDGN